MRLILKDCEISWPKLVEPETKFTATGVWEANITLTDEAAQQIVKAGGKYKTKDGVKFIKAKKNVQKRDGTKNARPKVVNANKEPLSDEEIRAIGNGSICNFAIAPYEWTFGGNKGITFFLDAIQVVNLKTFTPEGADPFDVISGQDTEQLDAQPDNIF